MKDKKDLKEEIINFKGTALLKKAIPIAAVRSGKRTTSKFLRDWASKHKTVRKVMAELEEMKQKKNDQQREKRLQERLSNKSRKP